MKSYGHLNLQQNELQQAVFQVEQNFPATPIAGRIVFKDKVLYICIEITDGTPVWIPLTQQIDSYSHIQSASSDTWVVQHNLNTSLPSVQVYGYDNRAIFPDEIEVLDNNSVRITFNTPITGRAIILTGSADGTKKPTYAFDYTQPEPSDTWVIDHYLGYQPIVRVFSGNQEIQPLSVTFDTLFRVTITFSQPIVGVARLI